MRVNCVSLLMTMFVEFSWNNKWCPNLICGNSWSNQKEYYNVIPIKNIINWFNWETGMDPRRLICTAGLYLAPPCVKSCKIKSCANCQCQFKHSQLAAFQWDRPEWRPSTRFCCSHIWTQMLDNVREHLSFILLKASFSCGALLHFLVHLMLIVIIFLGWLITTTKLRLWHAFITFPWLHL